MAATFAIINDRWDVVLKSPSDKHETLVSLLTETRDLEVMLDRFIREREDHDDDDHTRKGRQLLDRVVVKREIVEMQMKSRADASPLENKSHGGREVKHLVSAVSGERIAFSLDDDDELPPAGGEAHLLVFERSNSEDGTTSAASTATTTSGYQRVGAGAGSGASADSRSSGSIRSSGAHHDDDLPHSSPVTARYKTPDSNQNPNPPMDPFGGGMTLSFGASFGGPSIIVAAASSSTMSSSSSSTSSGLTVSADGHVTKRAKSKDERDDDEIESDSKRPSNNTASNSTGAAAKVAPAPPPPAVAVIDEWKARHPNERYIRVKVLRDTLMGLVVLAVDKKNGQQVAIKLSHKGQVEAGRCLENPLKEAETLRRLGERGGHGHVLSLLHETKCESYYWTVLEFAARGEFFDLVSRDGRLENAAARRYFKQLCDGVHFIHSNGLCHLDLSLENCLLTDTDDLKICDFGVCREMPADSKMFAGVKDHKPGKLGYMAPEIFACTEYNGQAADIWSLGIVLFIILTGVPPYSIPAASDARFKMVCVQRQLKSLLTHWKMINHVDAHAVDLMQMMLSPAETRCNLDAIRSHPWLMATT